MKNLLRILPVIGLALILVPSCLYLLGAIDKPSMNTLMLVGTVLWFASAPMLIGAKPKS